MKIETVKYSISGMTCDHCAKSIEKKFEGKNGVISKSVNYKDAEGEFQYNSELLSKDEIVEQINSTGHYKVVDEIIKNNGNGNNIYDEDSLSSKKLRKNFDYDLIIIGGGSAAFSAAIKASSLEKKVLMINDGLPIGGTCVNVGCVPSKTLIRNGEQFYNSNNPNFTAITPGNSTLDFKEAIRQKTELVEELRQGKYIDILKDDKNVTILKGRAELVDNNTVSVEKDTYSAANILISTGSSTFIPDIPGLNEVGYLTNETLYDLEDLPEHLIVLGGRYIALENAQLFSRLGAKVTVLQRSNRIIPDEMPDVSEQLTESLIKENIDIKTGVKLKSVEKRGEKIVVVAMVKDKEEIIEGSHIFIATGRKGNTGNFESKGIELFGENFIKTNNFLETSIPNIYAAGDITGKYLFVYSAAYEGALAVENMFTENKRKTDYSVFPWVVFTDPQIAGVGMDENQAEGNKIDYDVSTISLSDVPRSIAARNTKGFIKLLRDKNSDKLIGARILASEGSELLMEIALAIKYGITVADLKNMFHPYLTLSEGVKIAAISFDMDVNKLSCCAV
ncbi:MAG: mercury(II) reductase [Ignavibacteriae bacterium]|nr:mercury(II) reductase [Ignavibacteriota bacterium]NOG99777.1 mercury(II) reductase [Ignavibacteriota bacterium]